jgi:hypothetical protein
MLQFVTQDVFFFHVKKKGNRSTRTNQPTNMSGTMAGMKHFFFKKKKKKKKN